MQSEDAKVEPQHFLFDEKGQLFFTKEGRKHYAEFEKHGYDLNRIKTVERLKQVIAEVSAMRFAEFDQELFDILNDPKASHDTRETARLLIAVFNPEAAAKTKIEPPIREDNVIYGKFGKDE